MLCSANNSGSSIMKYSALIKRKETIDGNKRDRENCFFRKILITLKISDIEF